MTVHMLLELNISSSTLLYSHYLDLILVHFALILSYGFKILNLEVIAKVQREHYILTF